MSTQNSSTQNPSTQTPSTRIAAATRTAAAQLASHQTSRSTRWRRGALPVLAAGVLTFATLTVGGPATAADAACGKLVDPAYSRVSPTLQTTVLTTNPAEATAAADRYGFTVDQGTPFRVSKSIRSGLVPVQRLWSAARSDFAWAATAQQAEALVAAGYVRQHVEFQAVSPTVADGCAAAVKVLTKGTKHRYTADPAAVSALTAQGWADQGVAFYAGSSAAPAPDPAPPAPERPGQPGQSIVPDTASAFSIAVIPDTQREVGSEADGRLSERTAWLAQNRSALDLQYVLHTGDMVNWDDPTHAMFRRASDAMATLDKAGIAWTGSIGNHDTAAVCPGGSACPGQPAAVTVRDTRTWNQYFPLSRFSGVQGAFEAGKSDNTWSTFSAGGKSWLVLNLELWPRAEVVSWADSVVAAHPGHNVIISTHAFLEVGGEISQSNGGYGATSPQYLYDNLIAKRPNVKLVFSGHVGGYSSRLQTTPSGNKVAMIMGTWHSDTTNPVRQVQIDPSKGQIVSHSWAPKTSETWEGANFTMTGLSFV